MEVEMKGKLVNRRRTHEPEDVARTRVKAVTQKSETTKTIGIWLLLIVIEFLKYYFHSLKIFRYFRTEFTGEKQIFRVELRKNVF